MTVRPTLPRPGPGEVLVRNTHFRAFPALRTVIGGGAEGAPFPGVSPGGPLFGAAVAEVVAAPGPGGPPVGAQVSHHLGRREYALVPAAGCTSFDGELPDPVAYLSQGALAPGPPGVLGVRRRKRGGRRRRGTAAGRARRGDRAADPAA
ncbi:hypothetical protein ACFWVP_20990 [Streptomyces sp. NPDC058637]|uniref:hypothetical protein n=1 Tax=Streptomyces sp. NPDC058637 TaxID=3346569 RepID=UPI00364DD621